MTHPIDVLLDEHALHRRMLTVLERIAAQVGRGRLFPAADVARVLGYFREFVETVHHAKEDGSLYPLVLSIGDDRTAEAVGQLIAEHDETKELLQSLSLFWEPGDLLEQERVGFCKLVRAYVRRLRRHMSREEVELFPTARGISIDDQRDALHHFEAVTAGRRPTAEWRALIAELEEHWVG